MYGQGFFYQAFVYLAAAVIAVPIAKRLGLGSVLGYLLAGIVIGPFGLSLIDNIEAIMHFTEFGVVMMLFLVGLELKPSLLWQMRTPILGMGGSQVLVSFAAIGLFGAFFLPWQQSVAIGMILALSSTAIVLSTLREKGLMNTSPGQSIFSVLLFQDLAVIPVMIALPLLAGAAAVLALAVAQIEPLRIRVMSLLAGRQDSSNNFRINVWLAAIEMIQDRPWLGIGPGNSAFNLIYPLYQQPKFNALSAYSVPLELLVEGGVPNLLAGRLLVPELVQRPMQLVVLGSGDPVLEQALRRAGCRRPSAGSPRPRPSRRAR